MIYLTGVSEKHDYNEIIQEFYILESYKAGLNASSGLSTKDKIQTFLYCQEIKQQLFQAIKTFSKMYPSSSYRFKMVDLPKGSAEFNQTLYYLWFK